MSSNTTCKTLPAVILLTILPQKHFFTQSLAPRAYYEDAISSSNESLQVTKILANTVSHNQLTHRTDRPHLCNAFDSQLSVQHHRDSAFSHQGIESLLRSSPVSLQQPSTPLLLQHKKERLTIQRPSSRTLIKKMII